MPLEGGLYQWAKLGFSEMTGFLVAWNLWLYVIVNTSELGLQVTTYLSYALGPDARWIASHKPLIAAVGRRAHRRHRRSSRRSASAIGKWLHNAGGALIMILFGALVLLPFLNYVHGHVAASRVPFSLALPGAARC